MLTYASLSQHLSLVKLLGGRHPLGDLGWRGGGLHQVWSVMEEIETYVRYHSPGAIIAEATKGSVGEVEAESVTEACFVCAGLVPVGLSL